ncbi:MAG: sigma-70 family RNA polymerase sigma factor [Phycisphaeraceae bacterium]|nr:sigma-70 family RNA polymerase sigma factor [Phycisphaerales bacterium]MCB9859251.1 sigma-70 family RNA polymerase sigma factor [Phycisphaeraceae bacterium]
MSNDSSPISSATPRHNAEELLPLIYGELRRLAESRLRSLPPGQTLQATALVHEVFIKLVGQSDPGWDGKGHLFGAAARAMKEVLVDQARRKGALKRGGDRQRELLDPNAIAQDDDSSLWEDILEVDACMEQFEREHPRSAQVVMLMYFGGLNSHQVAAALDLSERTVRRDWRFAQAWMSARLSKDEYHGRIDT